MVRSVPKNQITVLSSASFNYHAHWSEILALALVPATYAITTGFSRSYVTQNSQINGIRDIQNSYHHSALTCISCFHLQSNFPLVSVTEIIRIFNCTSTTVQQHIEGYQNSLVHVPLIPLITVYVTGIQTEFCGTPGMATFRGSVSLLSL